MIEERKPGVPTPAAAMPGALAKPVPPKTVTTPEVTEILGALDEEKRLLPALRAVQRRAREAICALRARGLRWLQMATRILTASGRSAPLAERQRFAEALRARSHGCCSGTRRRVRRTTTEFPAKRS